MTAKRALGDFCDFSLVSITMTDSEMVKKKKEKKSKAEALGKTLLRSSIAEK